MKIFFMLSLILISSLVMSQTQTRNAKEYLEMLKRSESSGAGNGGGNPIISEIFEEAYVGINLLLLGRRIDTATAEKIRVAIRETKIYPVDFTLCQDDFITDCDETTIYALKNYPAKKVILVDSRKLPNRWVNKTILAKRRDAIHEFAGIAGVEIANYSVSVLIDDERTLREFQEKKEFKTYFKILNDLYHTLPPSEESDFAGKWKADTILRPLKLQFSKTANESVVSDYTRVEIGETTEKDKLGLSMFKIMVSQNTIINHEPLACMWHNGRVKNGEFYCNGTDWQDDAYFRKWSGRTKKAFAPSFQITNPKKISPFSCKALSEDRLLCRLISEDESTVLTYLRSSYIRWDSHQYIFYTRQ